MGNGFVKYLIESVLSVIYCRDEVCVLCKRGIFTDNLICEECLSGIDFFNDSFRLGKDGSNLQCYSAVYYKGPVKELIQKLKYKSDFYCGEILGDFITKLLSCSHIKFDIITFVPMTRKALAKRGFNQSEFLARYVAKSFNKPVVKCLDKIKNTKDQIGLDREGRFKNLEGCFKIKNGNFILSKNILLIDDVVTTGATAIHCCQELLNHGASEVTILTAAKSKL
jgi:competence protein ComFC